MADRKMSAEEKRWQAESDAHTLSNAEMIKGDRSRLSGAKKAATRLAKDAQKQAKAISKVAKTKPAKKASRGRKKR